MTETERVFPLQRPFCSMRLEKAADKDDNGCAVMIFNFNYTINGTYPKLIGLI